MDPNVSVVTQQEALEVVSAELSSLLEEWDDAEPVTRKMKLAEISATLNEAVKMK